MTKTTETQLALHEQRISVMEVSATRVESKIDLLIERIDNRFVGKTEYEKDVEDQKAVNKTLVDEVELIKQAMVTKEQMKTYQRSQFWQKFFTAIGSAIITLTIAFIMYEINKNT
jgi:hypothetical protein